MPPKTTLTGPPKCTECQGTYTLLWHPVGANSQLCHECHMKKQSDQQDTTSATAETGVIGSAGFRPPKNPVPTDIGEEIENRRSNNNKTTTAEEKRLRKSTRATRFKSKTGNTNTNSNATNGIGSHLNALNAGGNGSGALGGGVTIKISSKGRNRRSMFKRPPQRAPITQAVTQVVDSVFHKGSYLQIGDIVSLADGDGSIYYAQIRGLLIDNFCEKSAFLTWLIPSQASPDPAEGFDAATYLIGPDEELSRKLSCMEFIMHAPSNYYWDRTTPFPLPEHMEPDTRPGGYIWTTLPEYHRKKTSAPS